MSARVVTRWRARPRGAGSSAISVAAPAAAGTRAGSTIRFSCGTTAAPRRYGSTAPISSGDPICSHCCGQYHRQSAALLGLGLEPAAQINRFSDRPIRDQRGRNCAVVRWVAGAGRNPVMAMCCAISPTRWNPTTKRRNEESIAAPSPALTAGAAADHADLAAGREGYVERPPGHVSAAARGSSRISKSFRMPSYLLEQACSQLYAPDQLL